MTESPETSFLIERAQQGDVAAFEQLIRAQIAAVRRFARVYAPTEEDAADLAQEAMLKAYRSIRSYRYRSAFSTWLFAITRNVCIDYRRSRRGRESALEVPYEPDAAGSTSSAPRPDAELSREQVRSQVWHALRKLPDEFRAVLVLVDIEGLSYAEVSVIERVPVGTVKSRTARGRSRLRKLLEHGNPECAGIVQRGEEVQPS